MTWAALTVLIFSQDARAQGTAASVHFPFQLIDNRVFVPLTINGQGPFLFVLDTGAGDGTAVSLETYRHLRLPELGSNVVTGAGAGTQSAIRTEAQSVILGAGENLNREHDEREKTSVKLGPMALTALSLGRMAETIGFTHLDGILGQIVFDRYVVTIDFERAVITLDDPITYQPPIGAIVIPFTIYDHIVPLCDGKVDGISGKFLLDLGDRSSLTVYRPFWSAHNLDHARPPVIAAMTGIGIGGPIMGKVTRVGYLGLGPVRIQAPVTRLTLQTSSAINEAIVSGSVGTGVLKRFRVTFDYPHGRMILVPTAALDTPDLYDRAGLWLGRNNADLVVVDVTPGGPAAEAGILPGAKVVTINGRLSKNVDLLMLREQLKKPDVDSMEIVMQTPGQLRPTPRRVILRDLIAPPA